MRVFGRLTSITHTPKKYANLSEEICKRLGVDLVAIRERKRNSPIFDLSRIGKNDRVSIIYAWISSDDLAQVIEVSKTDTKSAMELFHNFVVYYGLSGASSKYAFLEGATLKRILEHRNSSTQTADYKLTKTQKVYVQASICVPSDEVTIIEESLIVAGRFLNQKLMVLWNERIRMAVQEYDFELAFEVIYDLIMFPRLDNLKSITTETRLEIDLLNDLNWDSTALIDYENPIEIVERVFKPDEPKDNCKLEIHFNEEGRTIIVTYEDQDTEFENGLPALQDLYKREIAKCDLATDLQQQINTENPRFFTVNRKYTVIVKKKTSGYSRLSESCSYEILSGPVVPNITSRLGIISRSLYVFHNKWVYQHNIKEILLFIDQHGCIRIRNLVNSSTTSPTKTRRSMESTVNCETTNTNRFPRDKITLAVMGGYLKNENSNRPEKFLLGYHVNFDRLEGVCILERGLTDDELERFENIFKEIQSSDKPKNYHTNGLETPSVWFDKIIYFNMIYQCITYKNGPIRIEIPRFESRNTTDRFPISKSCLLRIYESSSTSSE